MKTVPLKGKIGDREREENDRAKSEQTRADLDYIAMMTGLKLEEEKADERNVPEGQRLL